jgi:glycosyltransferase involved in cell wall biosynthesis
MEERLLKKADIVFATSQYLYKEKINYNKNTFYMPHGVDVELFRKALSTDTPVAEVLKNLRKPIIGFFGLVCSEWLDFELLKFMSEAHPEWSIVLIGKVADDVPNVDNWKNIIFLGPRNYTDLPSFCKAFDVAIIPFKITELVKNVNPLKLKEYLAAGNPVVSTRLPELEKYSGIISITNDYGDFVKFIEEIIKNDDYQSRIKRSELVKDDSWEGKFNQISEIILNNK